MESKLVDIIASADWKTLTPRLEHYADLLMRRRIWRGLRVSTGSRGQLLAAGKSADEFVMEAVDALLHGPRTYEYEFSLEKNIRRTVESLISAWKKKSDRQPLVDHAPMKSEDGEEFDPIMAAADLKSLEGSEATRNETRAHQKQLLDDFEVSLQNDKDLLAILDAYKSDFTKPAEIEELTGISASRVYELKRKLETKMTTFMINHPSEEAAGLKGRFL